MKARSLSEFQSALSRQLIPRWNFLFSDDRNIYWVHNAVIARRSRGYDWTKPVPGWMSATDWGPFLPFSDNPQLLKSTHRIPAKLQQSAVARHEDILAYGLSSPPPTTCKSLPPLTLEKKR